MKWYIRAHQVFRAQLFFQILLQKSTVDSAKDINGSRISGDQFFLPICLSQELFGNIWNTELQNPSESSQIGWTSDPKVLVLTWHGNLLSGSLSESVPAGADLQISCTRTYK